MQVHSLCSCITYCSAGQIRIPRSRELIVAISSGVNLKSKMFIFCFMRSLELDFGMGMVPISICDE